MSLAAFAGALLLVMLGMMTAEAAYSAIDWRVLFLIAGMFPMAQAMEKTGLTSVFSGMFSELFAGQSPLWPVAAVYFFTVVTTQIVGGQVSALFTGPVALTMAGEFGIDPKAVAVLVGVACSNCFVTAIAHPVNLLVSGPGGYKAKDFVRVGSLLQVLCFATAMGMAHYFWHIG
jgi:di/tricarboxylate transporter